jgi:hypothetical protein
MTGYLYRAAARPVCHAVLAAALALGLAACGREQTDAAPPSVAVAQAEPADLLYVGDSIVTMDPARPAARAVAVKDGRIVAVGERAELEASRTGPGTRVVDIGGGTMLPGFIDGHSHISQALTFANWANVSIPPVGAVDSIGSLLDALRRHVAARGGVAPGEWILAYGYDPDGLAEKRHLTRADLDPAFPDNPVMLLHVSGHGIVLNSAGLRLAKIDASTPTPAGGVIVRMPGSEEPAGLLMETAAMLAYAAVPRPTPEQQLASLDEVQKLYARNGYTTIQEGASDGPTLELLRRAVAADALWLDVVALPLVLQPGDLDARLQDRFGSYEGHLKLGGIKVLTDGSPQGRTAYFSAPMLVHGPGDETDWRGKPFIAPAQYDEIVQRVYASGIPLWTHANGDGAIDMVIAAHEKAGAKAADDRRDVVVHSQFVRPDQLDAYARLGIAATFFSNHAFYWGDVHVRNLGEERAFFLSPLKTAHAKGVKYSNHTDYGVTPLDPAMVLWTAVTRQSRSGAVIGPEERISPQRALEAMTIDAAWIYHEEDSKGSISPGKLADFVVLDANPLTVPPDRLRELQVLATVKEGRLVAGKL